MSISTYATLVTAVTEYLARDNDTTLVARIPDFITLAEAKFNRDLKHPQMESRSTAAVNTASDEPEFITLPGDFQAMRRVRLSSVTGKPPLQFMSGEQADAYRSGISNVTGQPCYFTIFGTEMELIPTPDQAYTIEMVYRATLSALTASNTTNWLLTLAPDAYLYGCLLEAAPYMKEDSRVPLWASAMSTVLDSLNRHGMDQSYNAGHASMRIDGPTP